MGRPILLGMLLVAIAFSVLAQNSEKPQSVNKTPADGYTVHVTAKHLVNGHEMGPFHHYCKVMTGDHLPDLRFCRSERHDEPSGIYRG